MSTVIINDTTPRVKYTANGSTTRFDFDFVCFQTSDLVVYVGDTKTTTGFTITHDATTLKGYITFDTAPASGTGITLVREMPYNQTVDFTQVALLQRDPLHNEFSRVFAMIQQINEALGRSVTVDVYSDTRPDELVGMIEALYAIKDDMTTDAANIASITTTAGSIANVNTVAGDSAKINALAAITVEIGSCYTNMSAILDAPTQASNAASSASSASGSATLAQKWATDNALVASTDYSAKEYAVGSLDAGSAKDWAIKEGGQVGTTGKYSAKVYSLAAENHYEKARDWASKTNGQVESTDYSSKAYAISEGLISEGSSKEWSAKAKAWATSTTVVEDGKYGASYYALQAYNANVSAQNNKTLSQDWATKTDGPVEGSDYSAKWYALNTDASGKANKDLSNLSVTGEAHFANPDLSNLSATGNSKFQAPITGAASSVVLNDLYSNRVVTTNASGKITSTDVSVTEIGYVAGVTSAIQTQLDGKQRFPNYADASAVAVCTQSNFSTNLPYTCPANGFIQIRPASGGTSYFEGAVNGGSYTISSVQSNYALFPVKQGDILTRTNSSGTWSVYFIHER